MLQAVYILAFGVIAFLAFRNLAMNVMTLGQEQRQPRRSRPRTAPHPELIDQDGNLTNEPLLVIRSATTDDIRSRLDAIYQESPDELDV